MVDKFCSIMIRYTDYVYDDNGFLLDKDDRMILLNAVDETSINATSDITTHPVVSGDMVADHMIKQPITLSFNGSFSKKGSKNIIFTSNGETVELKLFEIQRFFEEIKDHASICQIWKETTSSNDRFLRRNNMVLSSIMWKENIDSLDFSFTFTQIQVSNVSAQSEQELDKDEVDISDENLPEVTEATQLNFLEDILDFKNDAMINKLISDICNESGITSDSFYRQEQTFTGIATGGAIGLTGDVLVGVGASTSFSPVGWALVAAGILVVAISAWSGSTRENEFVKRRAAVFNDWQDDVQRETYQEMQSEIATQIKQLNNNFFVYQFSSNQAQDCLLTIGTNYYVFEVRRNSVMTGVSNDEWTLSVKDEQNNIVVGNISFAIAKESFYDCGRMYGKNLFTLNNKVTIVCLMKVPHAGYASNDLRNYCILVTSTSPTDFYEKIKKVIKIAIAQ